MTNNMDRNKKYTTMAVITFLRPILLFSSSARYVIPLAIVTILSMVLFSNPVLYAHTFSENENALFLTLIDKIKAETQLIELDFLNNIQQAHQHAESAVALLTQNDPMVNITWASEISERNPRVVADLLHSLSDLKTTIAAASPNSTYSLVQSKVTNIGNLLDEAVSARISKDLLDNPKTQALVLANLGNEIYTHYGSALGLSSNTIASMGGMSMGANKGSSKNMNTSSSGPAVMNQNNLPIKNVTSYETAQSLASIAQQVFSKDLKPISPANATGSTANIEKYINQLKNAVDNKTSFMNVMKLVHVKLHPTMIAAYNLTLGP
ncbi:MAG: hypothetical protein WBE68_27830 [Candidatus Nitrosopolaris sp.]